MDDLMAAPDKEIELELADLIIERDSIRSENQTYRMALHERNEENNSLRSQLEALSKPPTAGEASRLDVAVSPDRHIPLPITLRALEQFLAARAKKAKGQ